ncbi:MAG TPA: M23 family metallopeptidase [Opitutaceae bacterium]
MNRRVWLLLPLSWAALFAGAGRAQPLELAWPTPNPAFREGMGIERFVQPTVSGETTSGLFGCVRSDGAQFHEGLDLFPVARDAHGEAIDAVFAAMPGVVAHVNARPAESSYGRYVVLEHTGAAPAVYTLYAHLRAVQPGLKRGDRVTPGQVLGTMGRSAGGYSIPKDRAHLHFEIGVRVTDAFQAWYDGRKFGSPNEHGVWNGMNLMGLDPLDFYRKLQERRVDDVAGYFAQMETAVRLRIATRRVPDFAIRYPVLVKGAVPAEGRAGWEIRFNATGVPFAWRPLGPGELSGYKPDEVRIVEVNTAVTHACRCKALVVKRGSRSEPGKDLQTVLQQLFGLR